MSDSPIKLGEILLAKHYITPAQLDHALTLQHSMPAENKPRLGTVLVKEMQLPMVRLTECLALQQGIPAASRDLLEAIDPANVAAFSAEACRAHGFIPLSLADGVLHLALRDPQEMPPSEALNHWVGLIQRYIIPELRLAYYLERVFGLQRPEPLAQIPDSWIADDFPQPVATQPIPMQPVPVAAPLNAIPMAAPIAARATPSGTPIAAPVAAPVAAPIALPASAPTPIPDLLGADEMPEYTNHDPAFDFGTEATVLDLDLNATVTGSPESDGAAALDAEPATDLGGVDLASPAEIAALGVHGGESVPEYDFPEGDESLEIANQPTQTGYGDGASALDFDLGNSEGDEQITELSDADLQEEQ